MGSVHVETSHIPGHTLGADRLRRLVPLVARRRAERVHGDTLFIAGCGRLFEGTPRRCMRRLAEPRAARRRHPGVLRPRVHRAEPPLRGPCRAEQRRHHPRLGARVGAARVRQTHLPSTLGDERKTNPFLRVSSEAIRSSVGIARDASDVEAFAAVRSAKDHFGDRRQRPPEIRGRAHRRRRMRSTGLGCLRHGPRPSSHVLYEIRGEEPDVRRARGRRFDPLRPPGVGRPRAGAGLLPLASLHRVPEILYRIYGRQFVRGPAHAARDRRDRVRARRPRHVEGPSLAPAALRGRAARRRARARALLEGQLQGVDGWVPFLVMGCVALAMDGWRRRKTLRLRAMLGVAIGLTALGRPGRPRVGLPFLLLWELLPRPRRWMHCVALLAGTFVMIMPVADKELEGREDVHPHHGQRGAQPLHQGEQRGGQRRLRAPPGRGLPSRGRGGRLRGAACGGTACEGKKLKLAGVSAWWSRKAGLGVHSRGPARGVDALLGTRTPNSDTEYTQLHDYADPRKSRVLGVLPDRGLRRNPGAGGAHQILGASAAR